MVSLFLVLSQDSRATDVAIKHDADLTNYEDLHSIKQNRRLSFAKRRMETISTEENSVYNKECKGKEVFSMRALFKGAH